MLKPQLRLHDRHSKQWSIACAGIAAAVRASVRTLCVNDPAFRFCGDTSSTARLVNEFAHTPPDLVLIDDALLNARYMTELARIHSALPAARTVLVGDTLDSAAILPALRLGIRGIIARRRVAFDLERALQAVAGGELWLSRRQLASLLMLTSAEPPDDGFLELTPRENAVMYRVLLGQSNKQIARALDIAEHTVKVHLHHVYAKLHVHRRFELLVYFRREALSGRV